MNKGFRSLIGNRSAISLSSIYINNDKRKIVPTVLFVLFAFMGSAGAVFSFLSCFDFQKELNGSIYALACIWIALTLGVSLLFLADRLRDKVFCVFLLGIIGTVLVRFETVLASFIKVCNVVIKAINDSYQMGLEKIAMPQGFPYDTGVEDALVLIVITVTFLTAYFVLGRTSVTGGICSTLPLTIFGIFFDIFPKMEFLLLSVTFWVVLVVFYASGKRGKRIANGAAYNGLYAAVVIWILFLSFQMIMPKEKYVRPAVLDNAKSFVEKNMAVLTERYNINFGQNEGKMGIGGGEFGSREEIHFSGDRVLEVTLPAASQNVYLRTKEYNSYVGNAWENNDAYFLNYFNGSFNDMGNSEQPQNITSSLLKNLENELYLYDVDYNTYERLVKNWHISIKDFSDSGAAFAPYGAVFDEGKMESDIMPVKKKGALYEYEVYTTDSLWNFCSLFPMETIFTHWDMISDQMPTVQDAVYYRLASNEKEYAAFVRKAYTQVPDDLSGMLRRYAPETVEYDYASQLEFASEIQQLFADNFSYTLAPGKVPQGMDGVDYFLNESRKGYCVYFASAATLIFRQAGIPARYVEGFVITPDMMRNASPDGTVNVTVRDDKAHAWTEIYIAGYGWIPIEVTPGYYEGNVYAQQNETEQVTQEDTSDSAEETTTAPKQEETTAHGNHNRDTSGTALRREPEKVILMILDILVVIFGLITVYELSGSKKQDKIHAVLYGKAGMNNNERAILTWWYIEELLSFKKVHLPDNLTVSEQKQFIKEHLESFSNGNWSDKIDYIAKAYFGNEPLTVQEASDIRDMARRLRKEVYRSLGRIEKIKFKYIKKL